MSDTVAETPHQPSKQEMKKAQQYQERRQRLINKGIPEQQVDQVIAREDYENLSPDKKIKRLESMLVGLAQNISQDVTGLVENDKLMADAYDINIRATRKLFAKLGIAEIEFTAITEEVEAEYRTEQQARIKAKKDAEERAKIEEALKAEGVKETLPSFTDQEVIPHSHPGNVHPEATSFGD